MRERGGIGTMRNLGAPRLALLLALSSLACSSAVASDLAETDANRALVALEARGVAAEKERDPETENRFRVLVARDDAAAAAAVLSQEAVPGHENPGVLQSLGSGSMVPSRLAEHARLLSGISGELERSLQAVDGVVSARVHLAAPDKSPFDPEQEPSKPSASVLLRHRGAQPPLASSEIQRLVAGAVPGLDPQAVSVVASTAAPVARPADRELRRVGPITVTRGSLSPLRLVAAGAVLLNLSLLVAVLLLWSKVKRTEVALGRARGGDAEPVAQ